jgi:hypothetical protein
MFAKSVTPDIAVQVCELYEQFTPQKDIEVKTKVPKHTQNRIIRHPARYTDNRVLELARKTKGYRPRKKTTAAKTATTQPTTRKARATHDADIAKVFAGGLDVIASAFKQAQKERDAALRELELLKAQHTAKIYQEAAKLLVGRFRHILAPESLEDLARQMQEIPGYSNGSGIAELLRPVGASLIKD